MHCTAFCFHPVSEYCHLWNHTGFETTTAEVITGTIIPPTITTTTPTSTTLAPGECPPSGFHLIAHPYDCSKYIICGEGAPIEYQCSQGLLFDPDTLECNPESEVDCKVLTGAPNSTSTTKTTTSSPTSPLITTLVTTTVGTTTWISSSSSLAPVECPSEGNHTIAHPYDCSKYFICTEGVPIEYQCAVGMLFDSDSLECRISSEVKCDVPP